jgi:hypothetical protein
MCAVPSDGRGPRTRSPPARRGATGPPSGARGRPVRRDCGNPRPGTPSSRAAGHQQVQSAPERAARQHRPDGGAPGRPHPQGIRALFAQHELGERGEDLRGEPGQEVLAEGGQVSSARSTCSADGGPPSGTHRSVPRAEDRSSRNASCRCTTGRRRPPGPGGAGAPLSGPGVRGADVGRLHQSLRGRAVGMRPAEGSARIQARVRRRTAPSPFVTPPPVTRRAPGRAVPSTTGRGRRAPSRRGRASVPPGLRERGVHLVPGPLAG